MERYFHIVHVCEGQPMPTDKHGAWKKGYAPCKCLMVREQSRERHQEANKERFIGATRKSGGVAVTNYAVPVVCSNKTRMKQGTNYLDRTLFHKWGGISGPKESEGLGACIAKSVRDNKFGRGKRGRKAGGKVVKPHAQTIFDKGLDPKHEPSLGRQALEIVRGKSLDAPTFGRKSPDLDMKATLVDCEARREAQRKWAKAFKPKT